MEITGSAIKIICQYTRWYHSDHWELQYETIGPSRWLKICYVNAEDERQNIYTPIEITNLPDTEKAVLDYDHLNGRFFVREIKS